MNEIEELKKEKIENLKRIRNSYIVRSSLWTAIAAFQITHFITYVSKYGDHLDATIYALLVALNTWYSQNYGKNAIDTNNQIKELKLKH